MSLVAVFCGLFSPLAAFAQADAPRGAAPRPDPGAQHRDRIRGAPIPPLRGPGEGRTTDKDPAKAQSPEQKLERAKLAYQRGDYGAVVLLLRPLLYPQTLLAQEEQVLLAHKLLALSDYFEHDEAGAEQEFNLLLSLRPDFALDPVVDPLQAVAFLDEIRRRNAERLEEIRRRQAEEEQRRRLEAEQLQKQAEALAQQRTRRIYIERVVHKRFSAVDLLPFGIPQLVARRRAMGAVLLVSEVLTGAASLSTWLVVRTRYPNGQYPARELVLSQALTGTYLGTGAVFWGLVLTGLIDALVHARTITEVRELSGPPPDLPPELHGAPRETPPLRAGLFLQLGDPLVPASPGLSVSVAGSF
jgi:hypothetical protein